MRIRQLFVILSVMGLFNAMAQDERYFREMMAGEFVEGKAELGPSPDIVAYSKAHDLDLTGDHRFERIIFERRDGVDWVSVYNFEKKRIFEYKLDTQAANSRVYKLKLSQVTSTKRLLILYFYEGVTDYLNLKANSRLYFITYDVNDFDQMIAQKGPAIWEEFSNKRGHYRQRSYDVNVVDLDSANAKEILVNHRTIRRIYRLSKNMKWVEM